MAGLGKHIKGHGKEKIQGHKVEHHKAKDIQMGAQMDQTPMTSPIHPDLASMAGDQGAPSTTEAAQANVPSMPSGMPAMKKGGRVKKK
jgi:hypothetical protein